MSRGRRHVGGRVPQRVLVLYDRRQSSIETARWDIVTRYAILMPHSARAQWCRQLNGRKKAGYRTAEIAEKVAGLLFQLDSSFSLRVYACRNRESMRRMGEHYHLHSVKLTPTDPTGNVVDVSENDTSPKE